LCPVLPRTMAVPTITASPLPGLPGSPSSAHRSADLDLPSTGCRRPGRRLVGASLTPCRADAVGPPPGSGTPCPNPPATRRRRWTHPLRALARHWSRCHPTRFDPPELLNRKRLLFVSTGSGRPHCGTGARFSAPAPRDASRLAVIPGLELSSVLEDRPRRCLYVTTLSECTWGACRICAIRPRNACPGYEVHGEGRLLLQADPPDVGLVNVGVDLHLVRSWAIRNSVAPVATPRRSTRPATSTLRETTTPFTGARINVLPITPPGPARPVSASTWGFAAVSCACVTSRAGLRGVSQASLGSLQLGHCRIVRRLVRVALLLRDPAFPEEASARVQLDLWRRGSATSWRTDVAWLSRIARPGHRCPLVQHGGLEFSSPPGLDSPWLERSLGRSAAIRHTLLGPRVEVHEELLESSRRLCVPTCTVTPALRVPVARSSTSNSRARLE